MKKILLSMALIALAVSFTGCSKKCKCTLYTNGKPYSTTFHEVGGLQSCSSLDLVDETYANTDIRRKCEPDE